MTESFAELFEESQVEAKMRPGTIVKGTIVFIELKLLKKLEMYFMSYTGPKILHAVLLQ